MSAFESPHIAAGISNSCGWHQALQTMGETAYRRWRARRQEGHSRHIDFWGTYACRCAAPWFPDVLFRGPVCDRVDPQTGNRTLYLTVDDGPTETGTPRLLDLFARHSVPATFFLVGQNAKAWPEAVPRMVAAGHAIGNHTYTHRDAWSSLFPAVAQELQQTRTLLEDQSGRPVTAVRPPHGHFTAKLRNWCREQHQQLVLWDLLPADFSPQTSVDQICRFTLRHLRPGSILVLHDNPQTVDRTPAALARLLPHLLEHGWTFKLLPQGTQRREVVK